MAVTLQHNETHARCSLFCSSGTMSVSNNHVSTKKFRKITLDMVLASTSLTRSSKETADAYLQRVTHLHLQNKKIRVIESLDQCTNLKVLYLYDNQIELIQNIGFATILQYLYLHNNLIKEIPHLPMPSLKKLYLDDNEIQTVSGLSACVHLEELHIARQRLPTYASLHFERDSLNAISRTLQTLEISGNGISLLAPFSGLYNLRKLYCQDNKVIDLAEVEMIVSLPRLEEANFKGNPCCTQFKYRDTAIGASSDAFQILDEVAVPKHQQVAIRGLMAHRRKIGAMSRFQRAINTQSGSQMEFDEQQYEGEYEGQYGNQYEDAPYEPAQQDQHAQQQMYDQDQQQEGEYKGQEAYEQNELDSFQQSTDNHF